MPGGPGGPYGPPPPRKGGSTGVIIGIIAGVLALIVGVFIAIVVVFNDSAEPTPPVAGGGGSSSGGSGSGRGGGGVPQGNSPQSSGEPKPSEFYDSDPSSVYAKLNNRSADARPTTLDEVFAEAKRLPSYGPFRGIRVTLKESRLDTDCTTGVWGSELQTALREAGCNQLIRGLYVDDNNDYLGQIFIANLQDQRGASDVSHSIDPEGGADGFFKPLTVSPAEKFGEGYSEARTEIHGHWLVMSWVQYTDGAQEKEFGDLIPMGVIIRNADDFITKRSVGVD
jgi:hypothetical protein